MLPLSDGISGTSLGAKPLYHDARKARMVERTRSVAVGGAQKRRRVEAAMKIRGADVYAGFLLPHLRPDMLAERSLNDA
jgi:hypothetical protein